MTESTSQQAERELEVGDRVRIRQGNWPLRSLVGKVGMVIEVFRLPRDSCLVRVAGESNSQREWFFYRDEVAPEDG